MQCSYRLWYTFTKGVCLCCTRWPWLRVLRFKTVKSFKVLIRGLWLVYSSYPFVVKIIQYHLMVCYICTWVWWTLFVNLAIKSFWICTKSGKHLKLTHFMGIAVNCFSVQSLEQLIVFLDSEKKPKHLLHLRCLQSSNKPNLGKFSRISNWNMAGKPIFQLRAAF